MWKTLFPGEPYELDSKHVHQENMPGERVVGENCTKYDLISAVQRQSPFFYQASDLISILKLRFYSFSIFIIFYFTVMQ